ncbi:MAG: hypothetical protein HUU32_22200 [Calditrichaceae bacterium]|nr:hypothetical protein [Calditrichia bacterium]NUQ44105.1 hypothetical protein [Calditrichaceae bacterium]
MTRNEIFTELKNVIYKVQILSGEKHFNIDEKIIPIGNLPGFDSLRAVETTIELGAALGCEIGGDINLFVSEDGKRALQLYEVVDRIYEQIK